MNPFIAEAWQRLEHELDRWQDAGCEASFWWRDDDTIAPTAALDRLADLGAAHRVPISIAVIPADMRPGLAEWLQSRPLITVLQHGYTHQNHARPGQRKLELGGDLDANQASDNLMRGLRRLQDEVGTHFCPVLVPPWNRVDAGLIEVLPAIGFCGISTTRARLEANPAPGLLQVNTHLDPVHWRHDGGFIGIYPALAQLVQHLGARRLGYRDADEPTGILTHHLVQNESVWRFCDDLLRFLNAHPAAAWRDASTIWDQK